MYKARLRAAGYGSDAEVAVSVQRPGIRQIVEQDLDIVQRIAAKSNSRTAGRATTGLAALVTGIRRRYAGGARLPG